MRSTRTLLGEACRLGFKDHEIENDQQGNGRDQADCYPPLSIAPIAIWNVTRFRKELCRPALADLERDQENHPK